MKAAFRHTGLRAWKRLYVCDRTYKDARIRIRLIISPSTDIRVGRCVAETG